MIRWELGTASFVLALYTTILWHDKSSLVAQTPIMLFGRAVRIFHSSRKMTFLFSCTPLVFHRLHLSHLKMIFDRRFVHKNWVDKESLKKIGSSRAFFHFITEKSVGCGMSCEEMTSSSTMVQYRVRIFGRQVEVSGSKFENRARRSSLQQP